MNPYQLDILEELREYLDLKIYRSIIAATHLAYPDLAIDNFCGTDPDQDAESFLQIIEQKINFTPADAPGDAGELANYTFRKKALFSYLLRGPAAEWYENNNTNASTRENFRTIFTTRFSDGRNKFQYRLEVEHCIRGDGEEIRNFLHRIKRTVDKGGPEDMNGIEATQQNAERDAQGRQRRRRYNDYSLKGSRPRYLQRKPQQNLMENPIATWNVFSTPIIQRDVSLQVCSNFLNDEEQTKARMATLGQEMKNLRSKVQERRVNAEEGIPRTVSPNQKGRQKCNKILQLLPHKRTYPKLVPQEGTGRWTETNRKRKNCREKSHVYPWLQQKNEDKTIDQYNGLEADISKEETRTTLTMDVREVSPLLIRNSLPVQTSHVGTTIRLMEGHMINAQINHPLEAIEIDLEMDLSTAKMRTGEAKKVFLFVHRLQGATSHKNFIPPTKKWST